LGTLVVLVLIIGLATALYVQRRREAALEARFEAVQEENEVLKRVSHRLSAYTQSLKNEQWAKKSD
jgi:hypothetical protein